MYSFVTSFDINYFSRGLVLINSLNSTQNTEKLKIWVICLDQATYFTLVAMKLPNVIPIQLEALECPKLLEVKNQRTQQEYFWTLTPFIIDFVLKNNRDIDNITYVDADMEFYQDVRPIFSKFKWDKHSILITPHFYTKFYDQSKVSGTYCVQWITVCQHDETGLVSRWKEQCLKWCFAKPEAGLFGDQYYLEDWPELYPEHVHILSDPRLLVGPWGAYEKEDLNNLIAYHFHGAKIFSKNYMFRGNYILKSKEIESLYRDYKKKLIFFNEIYLQKNLQDANFIRKMKLNIIKILWNARRLINYYGK